MRDDAAWNVCHRFDHFVKPAPRFGRFGTRLITLACYPTDHCLLSNNINDYYFVAQGKTVIPGVDDSEEMNITDVSYSRPIFFAFCLAVP